MASNPGPGTEAELDKVLQGMQDAERQYADEDEEAYEGDFGSEGEVSRRRAPDTEDDDDESQEEESDEETHWKRQN